MAAKGRSMVRRAKASAKALASVAKKVKPRRTNASRGGRGAASAVFAAEIRVRGPWGDRGGANAVIEGKADRSAGRGAEPEACVLDRWRAAKVLAKESRPRDVAGLLSAVAHAQRIQILIHLLGGEATHRALRDLTGAKAGPLYHHLGELRAAGLIGPKVRDLYVITRKGERAVLSALAMGRLCGKA